MEGKNGVLDLGRRQEHFTIDDKNVNVRIIPHFPRIDDPGVNLACIRGTKLTVKFHLCHIGIP